MKQDQTHELICNISGDQILQALKKLDYLSGNASNELQVSFNKSAQSFKIGQLGNRKINFTTYMAMKDGKKCMIKKIKMGQNKENFRMKGHKQFQKNCQKTKNKKNVLKQAIQNKSTNKRHHFSVFESTPEDRLIQKFNKSISQIHQSLQKMPISAANPQRNVKQGNPQKTPQIVAQQQQNGRQKLGERVPIHLRTNDLLQAKQQKINRMKRQLEIEQNRQDKQCTFKPVTNKYKNGIANKQKQNRAQRMQPNKNTRAGQNKHLLSLCEIQNESLDKQKQKNYCRINDFQSVNKIVQSGKIIKNKQKPLNPKYNLLLDFI